jgi:rubrerythrin
MRPTDDVSEISGGDPVCWLSQVCEECGLLVEEDLPAVCPRCGATVSADDAVE